VRKLLHYSVFRALDQVKCGSPWLLAPLRDLLHHDAFGGHLCSQHIAQTRSKLRQRLLASNSLATVSSFWSFEAARATVCYLTMRNLDDIIQWANDLSRIRLSVDGDMPVATSIGYAIIRPSRRIVFCRRARMVLQRNQGTDFYILTAFPMP
jgi:hypothetical protein